jgi:hypothetical protein
MIMINRTPGTFTVYRAYRNVPTRNEDFLRTAGTISEALGFRVLYEGANHFGIAIYEIEADGTETLRYDTESGIRGARPAHLIAHPPIGRVRGIDTDAAEADEYRNG